MTDILTLADRFHDALDRQDVQALERIIRAYQSIIERLQGEIDALVYEIGGMDNPSRGQVEKMARYKRLMKQSADELEKFTTFMDVELRALGTGMVQRGLAESMVLMRAAVFDNKEIIASLRDLPAAAVERLLGFLDPDGPLMERLQLLAPNTVKLLSESILQGIALGKNPRTWAKQITRAFGIGLSDSLRMARTVQLYSYREASRANYIANSDIIKGWQWFAKLDSTTCISCISQHGKIFPLDARLNDHHNGRCAMVPVTILSPNGHIPENAGEEWFNQQNELTQRKMMGPGKYDAWKGGKFKLSQVTKEETDNVYGLMKSERTLKELIGSE